jgi:hypothetical protein
MEKEKCANSTKKEGKIWYGPQEKKVDQKTCRAYNKYNLLLN